MHIGDGFVFLWRKLQDNPIFQNSFALHIAIYCLLRARHNPGDVVLRSSDLVHLERGQLVTGRHSIHEDTGISERSIRTALSFLESKMHFLTIRPTKRFSVITICKYDDYQSGGIFADHLTDQEPTMSRPRADHEPTTKKNEKNDKNIDPPLLKNIDPDPLLEGWGDPPRKKTRTARVPSNTPVMIRIGSWFGRKPDTAWTIDEAKVLRAIGDPPPEIDTVEAYYKAKIEKDDYRRRDVKTLLNNWTGECDRARKFLAARKEKRGY